MDKFYNLTTKTNKYIAVSIDHLSTELCYS